MHHTYLSCLFWKYWVHQIFQSAHQNIASHLHHPSFWVICVICIWAMVVSIANHDAFDGTFLPTSSWLAASLECTQSSKLYQMLTASKACHSSHCRGHWGFLWPVYSKSYLIDNWQASTWHKAKICTIFQFQCVAGHDCTVTSCPWIGQLSTFHFQW